LRVHNYVERVYNETLETVKQSFPQYVQELQGIADGSQVEFYKVSNEAIDAREFHARVEICKSG